MAKTLKSGDPVAWSSHGGEAHGKVVKKVIKPMTIKGHKVAASPENPEFLVETHDGKRAAHKAAALRRD
jgi:Hypervirulence associated proteins TUDOR domain